MATKWPSVAYHFHLDREITIAEAIEMREGDDPRAGDIWCHAECYKGEPRTGNRLFPVNLLSCPYFRRGKGSYTRVVDCEFERVMLSKGESYRFAQFYHDLLVWLNSGDGKENLSELFHISGVEESKSKVADIVISHTEKAPIDWTETRIIIVDKNRRRKASNEHTLVIDITHWTDSQLADFSNSGIRKMIDEWNQLLAKEGERGRQQEERAQYDAEEMKWIENNQLFILQARAIKHSTKLRYDHHDSNRKKLQASIEPQISGPEERGSEITIVEARAALTQLDIDDNIREMKREKSLVGMSEIVVAREIKAAHDDVERKIQGGDNPERRVKLGYYTYDFAELENLSKEYTEGTLSESGY